MGGEECTAPPTLKFGDQPHHPHLNFKIGTTTALLGWMKYWVEMALGDPLLAQLIAR